jgi:hypothetical protein
MLANGARSLTVSGLLWHQKAVLAVGTCSDHVPVPFLGPRNVCIGYGIIGANVRPN